MRKGGKWAMEIKIKAKIKLSYFLQLKPNIFLYQRLGWRIAFYYMLFLGHLYFFLNRKEKAKITKSLEDLYGHNNGRDDLKAITKRVFLGILSHYYEKVIILPKNWTGE
jgi:hypothetical protein